MHLSHLHIDSRARLQKQWVQVALGIVVSMLLTHASLFAQEETEETEETESVEEADERELQELTVVGSRHRHRSASDSPVPVDVLNGEEFAKYGDADMNELLSALVPSFNIAQEPISDAASFVRPPSLRGLSADSSLILVNGKRRHRGAVISWLTTGISSGSQGPDMVAIPAIALERVEVLRDGASAQYGSDAIAGIINFVLKSDDSGMTVDAKMGTHNEGDGERMTVAVNKGLPLGADGFLNFSIEFGTEGPTSRDVQRTDAQALIDAGNTHVRQPSAQIWGAPEVFDNQKYFVNLGMPISDEAEVYGFGSLNSRQVEGGFYYRNPHTRGGVFQGPVINGRPTLKAADFSGLTAFLIGDQGFSLAEAVEFASTRGGCPIVYIENDRPDPDGLRALQSTPTCWTLYHRFPGGFTPQFGAYVDDWSAGFGARGRTEGGWDWDVSYVQGSNRADFYIYNTINPQLLSLRSEIPTYYDAGQYRELDSVGNLGLAKQFATDMFYSDLSVAVGIEARSETFFVTAGEENSYFIDQNLALQGFGIGSNGFPGFQPGDAGKNTIRAMGGYLDFEANLTEEFLGGLAIRFEEYPDFGNTFDYKVSGRFQFAPNAAVRGAASTGFRVPTAGQAKVRNVTTEIIGGKLADAATLPPTNPIARQKGATDLTPETSTNFTFGVVIEHVMGDLDISADFYNITIEDRLTLTSNFSITQEDIDALEEAGVTDASSFTSVRFFTNQQTVTATGFDLVVTYPFDIAGGASDFTLAANWASLELSDFNPDFTDETRVRQIEEGKPSSKLTATLTHEQGALSLLGRVRYYGENFEAPFNDGSLGFVNPGKVLFDFEAGYRITDSMLIIFGQKNLFDTYPDEIPNPPETRLGQIYPEFSPFGFNGGFWYGRFRWER